MHPVRIGRLTRTLRRRLGWRQIDLARRAGVSQQTVSLVETGASRRLSLSTLEQILACLEAEVELVVRWRGGEVDRVTDAPHATLLGAVAELLVVDGWVVRAEVTYAIGRDRGSVDLLGFEPTARALLVVEVKSELVSADSTLRRHDEKVRLGAQIASQRFGWVAVNVSGLLVLPDASTPRRRIAGLASLFDRSYPLRGWAVRRWLSRPAGAVRACCSSRLPTALVIAEPSAPADASNVLGGRLPNAVRRVGGRSPVVGSSIPAANTTWVGD